MSPFAIESIDHVVITCKDIPKTITFYTTHLGMKHELFASKGVERYIFPLPHSSSFTSIFCSLSSQLTISFPHPYRHALLFGVQKLNLHQSGREFEPKARNVRPGSADLCFVTRHPIEEVQKVWREAGLEMEEGGEVVDRTGARGKLKSVYCRDPDGNLIE